MQRVFHTHWKQMGFITITPATIHIAAWKR